MCNINILAIANKTRKITPFLMGVSSHSFINNNHGEGIYIKSSDTIVKSENKINYFDYDLEQSNLIITHQRLSTSGFSIEYNHPFDNKDFVLVHNGIINQFEGVEGSDTFKFWTQFNKEFDKIRQTHKSRKEKIISIIMNLFEKDKGSYSIFIYDKKTELGYYFKNSSTNINFYKNDNYLFITTSEGNKELLNLLDDKEFVELEIKDRVLYLIEGIKTYRLAQMPEVPETKSEKYDLSYFSDKHKNKFWTICDNCGELIEDESYKSQNYEGKNLCSKCNFLEENFYLSE